MIISTRLFRFRWIQLTACFLFLLTAGGALAQTGADEITNEDKIKEAVQHLNEGRLAEARKLLEDLARSHPGNALVHYNLGNVYYLQKQYPEAIEHFKKVVQLDSPLKHPSLLYISKSYRQLGKLKVAFDHIRKLDENRLPKNLAALVRAEKAELQKAILRIGIGLYKKQQYDKALQIFEMALQLRPSDHARMFQAMALKRLGRTEEAEHDFMEIYRTTNNTTVKNNARILLKKPSKPSRKWWLYAEGSLGYNSNVFADGSEEDPITGAGFRVFGAGGVRLLSERSRTWNLNYSFNWEEIFDHDEARLIYNNLTAPLTYYPEQGMLRITPSFSHQVISTTHFRAVPGIEFRYEADRKPQGPGASYFFGRNISLNDRFSYMEGNIHQAQVYWKWPAGENGEHRLFYSFIQFGADPLPISGGFLPLEYFGHGPGYRFLNVTQGHWRHQGAVSYLYKDYEGVTVPLGNERTDHQVSAYLRNSTAINKDLDFFVNSTLVWNESTIDVGEVDNRDYVQFTIFAGIAW